MYLELTDEDAAVLRDFLSSRLGELSMEIADTDNPRFRRELVHRRGVLFRIHGALAPEADAV